LIGEVAPALDPQSAHWKIPRHSRRSVRKADDRGG
jgi:hypothetical protein